MMDYRQQQFPFPGGFPGGGGNVDRRLDRLDRRVDQLERQINQLDRRLDRIERRLGIREQDQQQQVPVQYPPQLPPHGYYY